MIDSAILNKLFVLSKTLLSSCSNNRDDVITIGNTVLVLCKVLAEHRVQKVDIWCCAKSLLKNFLIP
jgi:hypothetical protein